MGETPSELIWPIKGIVETGEFNCSNHPWRTFFDFLSMIASRNYNKRVTHIIRNSI